MDIQTLERIWPNIKAKVVHGEFGTLIALSGKGAKAVANTLADENYRNGTVNTRWRDVRYGLGYAVPLYDNPIDRYI